MKNINITILLGRLTADPKTFKSALGALIVAYTLAVRRPYVGNGPNAQDVDFIRCVAFGQVGAFAAKYLRKGQRIVIQGRLQTSRYTDKDGTTRYATQVVVTRHEFADGPKAISTSAPAEQTADNPAPASEDTLVELYDVDEGLPF